MLFFSLIYFFFNLGDTHGERKQTHIEKEELSKEFSQALHLSQRSGFNNSQTTSYVYRTEEVSKYMDDGESQGSLRKGGKLERTL